MNSIWNNNCTLFCSRFPQLASLLAPELKSFEQHPSLSFTSIPAKSGAPTAIEDTILLHSKYDPVREADQLVAGFDSTAYGAAVFLSFGLGYAPIAFAKKHTAIPLILVEPDASFLFTAFSLIDWTVVLEHQAVVFAIGASAQEAAAILDRYGASGCKQYAVPAQMDHAKAYFDSLTQVLSRQKQKAEINTNTLEKFSRLWLHNSCKNLHYLAELDGVEKYHNMTTLPFIILAAGPSLSSVLPYLPELKKRSIIVCVDTALHACLRAGVEPDFIILVDPQFACALHLEFLSAPSSTLITESAAYPSVFRFDCRQKVLCSSLFPIGQYFEKQLGSKGKLGAGGSVTTTAWDFARLCGTKAIYLAGMDLGFPSKQTHIRGSQFEERSHRTAMRTFTAETDTASSLFTANPSVAKDYNGNPMLTDQRMSLFSWWFESNCKLALESGVHTYTLTPQSLAIPGIEPVVATTLLEQADAQTSKNCFFADAEQNALKIREQPHPSFSQIFDSFATDLETLSSLAKRGIALCEHALADRTKIPQTFSALEQIDTQIMGSASKNAAALVFPTQRQLDAKANSLPHDKTLQPLYYSRLIYTELLAAVKEYRLALRIR